MESLWRTLYAVRLSALALGCCAACSGPPGAGELRGEDLGSFSVNASQSSNTCGEGALGESDELSFEVELSRLASEVFWNSRQAPLLSGGHFELRAQVLVQVRAGSAAAPAGCHVLRLDHIGVTLPGLETGDVQGFKGELDYRFEVAPEATCLPSDVPRAGVARLPCSIGYGLAGERIRPPILPTQG